MISSTFVSSSYIELFIYIFDLNIVNWKLEYLKILV